MRNLGFTPCIADGNVWMREALNTSKIESNEHARSDNHAKDNKDNYNLKTDERFPPGDMYLEYVLIYVDDLMVASRRAISVMEAISHVYTLNEDNKTKKCFGSTDMYLGTKIHKFKDKDADDNQYCWSMSGDHYVKNIVANLEEKLMNHVRQINTKQYSPFTTGYRPEMDTSPELDANQLNYFQEMIGCLRWAIKLGRSDIAKEVALL